MFKKLLEKLILRSRPSKRRACRLSATYLESLEARRMLSAVIATGPGTNQFVEDLAADFGGKVVDINNDGHLDLVGDSVYIGSQNGSWQTYANGPGVGELADIDGDNDLDVVSGKHWYENRGGGTSWTQHQIASITANDETVADFDGDGHLDVLITANDKVSWYENVNGDGSRWTEHAILGNGPFDFKAAVAYDVDGDGDQDFFLSYDQWYLVWVENPGNGNFESQHEVGLINDGPTVVERNLQLEVGDFDKDGRPDVFAIGKAYRSQLVWFQPNTNIKNEFRKTTIGRVDLPDAPKTVDLDNDGNLELIVGTRDDDRIFHYQRDTSGSFTRSVLTEDYIGAVIDSADLDSDGDVDLVGADFILWNSGGDFHIDTTDVSPNVIASGDTGAVFKIDATHNGQTGDPSLRLDGLSFLLDDGSGDVGSVPLDSSGVSSRFASWKVYADDGDGAFGTSDTLLLNLTDFTSVANGVLQAGLTNSPSFARLLSPGLTRSYWLEVEMAASGHESGDFRITHLTDQGRLAGQSAEARRWSSTTVVNDDYSPNVSATFESAGNISVSLNTVTTSAGIVPPGGITDLMRIEATHAGLTAGELSTLAFRFDDNGRPMTSAEVNSLIESLWIVDATFGSHLVRLEDLSVNSNGVLSVALPDGDSNLNLLNETKSYIVVIQTTSDSIDQAVRDFRMTHLTDEANGSDRSSVELASNDAPATLVSTPDHSVVVIAGTPVDIAVTSSVSTPIVSGQQVTYTLNVSNQHARTDAIGVTLKDVIPDVLQGVTLTDIQLSGGAISARSIGASLSGEWTDLLTLLHGSSVTYTLTGTLLTSDAGHQSANQAFLFTDASVELPYELVDSDLSNNAAIGADIIQAASTGTGEFNDSGINLADLDGTGAERINGVAVGDIDGDGDMDAIVTRGSTGSPDYSSVLINDGLGNYTDSGQDLGLSNSTAAILGDLDGDGDLDLYLATSTGSTTSNDNDRVYFNDGHGNFTASQQSFAYASNVAMMGDIDRDGDLDILIAGASQSATLLNNGSGVFTVINNNGLNNLQIGHLADMDGDGDLDVVGKQNHLYVYSNDGTGSFSRGASLGFWVQDFDLGDIDNDGDVDILATWGSTLYFGDERSMNSIGLLRNNGTGAFTSENLGGTSSYQEIELGDFDGDGDLDAFTVEDRYANVINGEVYDEDALVPAAIVGLLWTNDGSGGFADSGQTLDYDMSPTQESAFKDFSLTAADVNGDGSLDIVTGDFSIAKIWFNNVALTVAVDNTTVTISEGQTATNSGTFGGAGTVTVTASIGVITQGSGTWNWSFDTADGPDQSQTVTITATDSDGLQTTTTFSLVVNNFAPTVSVDNASVTVNEGQTATNTGTFGDAGDDTVTITASIGTITQGVGTWSWSFDTADGPDETQTVTITATDSDGLQTTTTFSLVVNNLAPTVSADNASVTVNEGQTATNTGTFGDAGDDTVTISASIGTITRGAGTWSWSFDTADGPDQSQTVTITATDSDGLQTTTTFNLVVNNVAPTVAADNLIVEVNEGSNATNTGIYFDPGRDSVLLTAQNFKGQVINHGDGTWTWRYTTYDGPDDSQTITINAKDSDGAITTTTFQLIVKNVAPTVSVENPVVTVNEGQTATNFGNFGDIGLDAVSLEASIGAFTEFGDGTWVWGFDTSDGPTQSQTVTITATDSDGAVTTTTFDLVVNNVAPTVAADNASVTVNEGQTATNTGTFGDVGDDTVTITASIGTITQGAGTWSWSFDTADGPDETQTVTITATDSDGLQTTTTFNLVVNNVAPTVSADNASVTVNEGQTATNTGTFGDAGDDTVTITASIGTITQGSGTWSWSFDTTDGPDETQTVTITATDSDGLETTTTFNLVVNNVAPTVAADNASVTVNEGQTATNTGTFGDAGDDSVTISASIGTITQGTVTWSWSFDTSDGPDQSQTVTITATDSDGLQTTTTFSLVVNNIAPTVAADNASVTVNEGQTATNTGTFGDVGDDTVTITASVGTITQGAGTWSWSFDTNDGPDQTQTVTITAEDSDGVQTTTTFELIVNNVAPTVATDNAAVNVNEGQTATNTGTFGDAGDDSVTITASIGKITQEAGTWSWSFDTTDGPDETQTVTITATDSDGLQTTTTFNLIVDNVAPTVAADNASVTVNEGQTATNTGTFGDAGDDIVTITASNGTITQGSGTWSWSFDTADGPDETQTVTITATDSDGLQTTTTFNLVVNNLAPTVAADNASVTVNEGQTATNTGIFGDGGDDVVTISASIGTITQGTGTWSWSFDTSDGPDETQTVTITATDSDGLQTTTTFNLVVNNVAPIVAADNASATVNEGQTATNTGTFGDVGDDTVTITASVGTITQGAGTWSWSFDTNDGPDQTQTVTITAEDSDGVQTTTTFELIVNNVAPTVATDNAAVNVNEGQTATNTGTFGDAGDDSVTITASIGTITQEAGTWSWSFDTTDGPDETQTVTITATDSDGLQTTTTFNLVVNNVAPTVSVDNASVTVNEGQTATNTGTFDDARDDIVTITASIGTITQGAGTWGWSFDTTDGPDQTQTVTITAEDSDGLQTTTTFSLVVNNVAPIVAADNASVSVNEGQTATNTGTFGDAGDDIVTITASIGTITQGAGTWGWSFDTNDGPDQTQTVTITAEDSDGVQTTTTFSLVVNNVAPTVVLDRAVVTVGEGLTATNTGTFGDSGDDSVTLTASIGTITQEDGTWSWSFDDTSIPNTSQFVTITAEDSDGVQTSVTFTLNVNSLSNIIGRTAGGNWWLAESNGQGQFENRYVGTWEPAVGWSDTIYADVNGDGRDDIVSRGVNGNIYAALDTGNGFVREQWGRWSPSVTWEYVQAADVNGDGMADIVGYNQGTWWVGVSNGQSFDTRYWGTWADVDWQDVRVADVNGDGLSDIVGRVDGNWWVAVSNGSSFTNQLWGYWVNDLSWADVNVADVNGDGLSDIVGRANGNWWVAVSDGTSFTNQPWGYWVDSISWTDVNVADVNGDGQADIVGRANGNWWVGVSNGSSFTNQFWGYWVNDITWEDVKVADVNGDGQADIVGRSAGNWWVAVSNGSSFTNQLWGYWVPQDWQDVGVLNLGVTHQSTQSSVTPVSSIDEDEENFWAIY